MNKILVVDDEESVREVLKSMIEAGGYGADTAVDGEDGLEKIKAENYSLVICDINMPVLDGVGFLKKAKEIFPDLPIVFVTAFGKDKIILDAMKLGLADYLEKPFRMNDVMDIIKKYTKN
jgi:DNA-binding NtrC family response regulator